MAALDLKCQRKDLYAPPATEVRVVDVPPMRYLALDGAGDPNVAPAYTEAVEALFTLAYALKFHARRAEPPLDYAVMPLEGLWWLPDGEMFDPAHKERLSWTLLIRQPDEIGDAAIAAARQEVARKKALPALERVRTLTLHEGPCAQILHLGPFDDEGPTVARLHDFIAARGAALRDKHHEIYLSDMRRVAPAKLRTIVRQPFAEAE